MTEQGALCRLAPFLLLAIAACAPVRPQPAAPPRSQAPPGWTLPPLPPRPDPQPRLADRLMVYKSARRLEAWTGDRLLLSISGIQLGWAPVGPKRFEGDGRTPEGQYWIDWRNPNSAYHLSLHISYPNGAQVAFARAHNRSAGGLIMIHGQPNGASSRMSGDWTDGCIAVSDAEIEALWAIVPDGAAVNIVP